MNQLGETFLQQVLKGIVAPVAQQAVASAPVQSVVTQASAAIVQAQAAARKAEMLAWALGVSWALTFIFYIVPRMESPIPRGFRRGRA